jgi:two-component system sensor histidine kinase HydH
MEEALRKPVIQEPACGFLSFDDQVAILGQGVADRLDNISATVRSLGRYSYEREIRIDETINGLLRPLIEEIHRVSLLLDNFRSLEVVSLDLKPTSLAALVKDCLVLESVKTARGRTRIEYEVPLDLPVIMADEQKLKQVILNLCKNAVEAMPDGGTVTVRTYTSPEEVCLDIRDGGEGISEDIQVFTPFMSSKAYGSGIGLFVSRRIVSAHGGTISYTSKKGEGTTFHLALPIDHSRDSGQLDG